MHRRKPTHPGEVLLEDVIKPLGITITEAAQDLGISRKTVSELIHGKCGLSPEMAVRIAKATNRALVQSPFGSLRLLQLYLVPCCKLDHKTKNPLDFLCPQM